MEFSGWFIKRLGPYFKYSDTHKDAQGNGLLERFTNVIEDEFDQDIIPDIPNVTGLLDIANVDTKYLDNLAYQLGLPPDYFSSEDTYRRFLDVVISIYRVKGTLLGYQILFALFGLSVQILEHDYPYHVLYDSTFNYDDGEFYDWGCKGCSEYSLVFNDLSVNQVIPSTPGIISIPSTVMSQLEEIVEFLEPINAKLKGIFPYLPLQDEYEVVATESATGTIHDLQTYDKTPVLLYDNAETYDDKTTSTVTLV